MDFEAIKFCFSVLSWQSDYFSVTPEDVARKLYRELLESGKDPSTFDCDKELIHLGLAFNTLDGVHYLGLDEL